MNRATGWGLLLGWAAVGGSASIAWAAEEPRPIPPDRQARLLKQYPGMDADQDGKITRAEMRQYLAEHHAQNRKDLAKPETTDEGPRRPIAGPGPKGLYPDPAQMLKSYPQADTDKDGRLGPEEMRAFIRAHGADVRADLLKQHPEMDTNQDGVLTEEELRSAREREGLRARLVELVQKRFPEADTNKDGRLAPEELRAYLQTNGDKVRAEILKNHPKLDRDGDGVLSPEEFMAAMRGAPARPVMDRAQRAQRERRILNSFPEADTDKDGRLSDAEFRAWHRQHPEAGPPPAGPPKPARPGKAAQPKREGKVRQPRTEKPAP